MGKEWDECSLAQPHYPGLCLECSRKKSFLKEVSSPQCVVQHTSLWEFPLCSEVVIPSVAKEEKTNSLYLCRGGSRYSHESLTYPRSLGELGCGLL